MDIFWIALAVGIIFLIFFFSAFTVNVSEQQICILTSPFGPYRGYIYGAGMHLKPFLASVERYSTNVRIMEVGIGMNIENISVHFKVSLSYQLNFDPNASEDAMYQAMYQAMYTYKYVDGFIDSTLRDAWLHAYSVFTSSSQVSYLKDERYIQSALVTLQARMANCGWTPISLFLESVDTKNLTMFGSVTPNQGGQQNICLPLQTRT